MATLLLLTNDMHASAEILPALELLPHSVKVAQAEATALLDAPAADIILLDARRDLVGARSLCRLIETTGNDSPLLVIASEGGLAAFSADWGFTDLLLSTAGPAEVDVRIRLAMAPSPSAAGDPLIQSGNIVIDEAGYSAKLNGTQLDLTYTEFELLKYLAQHPGRVFSRQQLLSDVWGYDYYGGTRTVDVHVRRLRAKLGPEYESVIGTVRNVGYRFVAPGRGQRPPHLLRRTHPKHTARVGLCPIHTSRAILAFARDYSRANAGFAREVGVRKGEAPRPLKAPRERSAAPRPDACGPAARREARRVVRTGRRRSTCATIMNARVSEQQDRGRREPSGDDDGGDADPDRHRHHQVGRRAGRRR